MISRLAFALLLASAVDAAVPVAPEASDASVNAWPNPSAETGISGAAALSPDVTSLRVSRQPADGWRGRSSFQLRFIAGRTGTAALVFGAAKGPAVDVAAGDTCYFRVSGKVPTGSAGAILELRARWLDISGHLLAETPALSYAAASRSWSVLDGWDTAPAGTAHAALALYVTSATGATVLRADGVQITVNPRRVPPYVDGAQPGCAWLGTPHASASRGPASAINLVPNPSFEYGTGNWTARAGPGAAVRAFSPSQAWAGSGRTSIHLAGHVASRHGSRFWMASRPVAVSGGQEYTLRAALNAAALPAGGQVALGLDWLDSSGSPVPAFRQSNQVNIAARGVHELQITAPAPRDAAAAEITVTAGGAPGDYDLSADSFSLIADSGAAPSRPFWTGFNDQLLNRGPLTLEQDLAHDRQLGVNAVRLPVNLLLNDLYKQVWPTPDAPINLDPLAPTIDAFFQAGIRVLLLAPITPWMLKERGLDPAHYADVGRLCAAFVRRWPRIVAVEVGNEVNTAQFWRPAADPVRYVQFLESVYRAVKAVDPAMPVLAPSCNAPLTKPGKNMSIPDYMKGFYEAGGGRWCDALSIHPYPYGASSGSGTDRSREFWSGAVDCMRQLREVRHAFHDDAKPIWITELGSATTPPAYPPLLKTISEEQQARGTVLLYDWARRQPDVQAIIYHTNASRPKHPEGDYGIFEPDGRLKPAYLALESELHRAAPAYFDGDTPGCRWLGPPGASPSMRADGHPSPSR